MAGQERKLSQSDILAAEKGTIRKKWHGRLSVALVYPNHYHIGMSSLGFQVVYSLFNKIPEIVCERAFLPEEEGGCPLSVESSRRLGDFDVLAFSVSFENDYINILKILEAASIPLKAEERQERYPLVLAGGVAVFLNPEPLADFMDNFLLGEGEEIIPDFSRILLEARNSGQSRGELLLRLARDMDSVYVPRFYTPEYDQYGRLRSVHSLNDVSLKVKRAFVPGTSLPERHSVVLTPFTEFKDKFLVEIGSGCSRGCRFCAAGYIYRPPRPWPEEHISELIAKAADVEEVGLVGIEVSDTAVIERICRKLMESEKRPSFSSLRADCLTTELLDVLRASGLRTVTIAPDAGSERLRRVINKGLSEDNILKAAEKLAEWDILNLKLYFMLGLPTEQVEDVEEIIKLVKKLKHVVLKVSRGKKRMGSITLSVNSFVPKPWTPFQWVGMEESKNIEFKKELLSAGLKHEGNVKVTFDVTKWAYVQALLARGDRRAGRFLEAALKTSSWKKAFKTVLVNPDFFVCRERDRDELFPWDFIDHGIKKDYLWEEYQKALKAERTAPCMVTKCKRCGVC